MREQNTIEKTRRECAEEAQREAERVRKLHEQEIDRLNQRFVIVSINKFVIYIYDITLLQLNNVTKEAFSSKQCNYTPRYIVYGGYIGVTLVFGRFVGPLVCVHFL